MIGLGDMRSPELMSKASLLKGKMLDRSRKACGHSPVFGAAERGGYPTMPSLDARAY